MPKDGTVHELTSNVIHLYLFWLVSLIIAFIGECISLQNYEILRIFTRNQLRFVQIHGEQWCGKRGFRRFNELGPRAPEDSELQLLLHE